MQRILIWRIAVLLSAIWLLPMLLIRAQPYDGSALQAFFALPEDCAAPCFLGIQPGQTTLNEVVRLLRQNAWVEQDSFDNPASVIYNVLDWRWSETAPQWIDRRRSSVVALGARQVALVVVKTTLTWGDFVLALGMPDEYHLVPVSEALSALMDSEYQHEGWYADRGLLVYAGGACWNSSSTVYEWTVVLHYRDTAPEFGVEATSPGMTGCR
jgi:hypothetical protein